MNWLLKIVDGPMKGAEIALVSGTRMKFGSGEACDIVIADATLASEAFELDVTDEAVTLVAPGSEAVVMRPYEVRTFGTTGLAVGPGEGVWQDLVYPAREEPAEEPSAAEPEPETGPKEPAGFEPASATPTEKASERRGHGCLFGVLALIVLLLLAVVLFLRFRPQVMRGADWALDRVLGRNDAVSSAAVSVPPDEAPSLERLAREHGLSLAETNGVPLLAGNLARRTERLAIRALALAGDRRTRFDLTDDETLKSSVETLLFTLGERGLKVLSATNRVVRLGGASRDPGLVNRALEALRADIPYMRAVSTEDVVSGAFAEAVEPAVSVSESKPTVKDAKPVAAAVAAVASSAPSAPSARARRPDLPVAGVLTTPYPCVVLRDGTRCVEGAQIGGLVLVRIEADRLTFRNGSNTLVWEP